MLPKFTMKALEVFRASTVDKTEEIAIFQRLWQGFEKCQTHGMRLRCLLFFFEDHFTSGETPEEFFHMNCIF